jgi:hypothetical protein
MDWLALPPQAGLDQITYLSLNINFSITPVRSSYQKPMVFNRVHGFLQLTLGTCYVCPGPSCSCKHTLLRAIAHAFQRLHVIGLCPLAFGRFRTDRYTPCPCNNASTTSLFFFLFSGFKVYLTRFVILEKS